MYSKNTDFHAQSGNLKKKNQKYSKSKRSEDDKLTLKIGALICGRLFLLLLEHKQFQGIVDYEFDLCACLRTPLQKRMESNPRIYKPVNTFALCMSFDIN